MKLANHAGRAVLVHQDGVTDVATASDGRFGPDIQSVYSHWAAFRDWAAGAPRGRAPRDPVGAGLESVEAVAPRPGQLFAVGLNYRAHALESGLDLPEVPLVFTKFASSVAAPNGVLDLPTDMVDWEVEVAVVIGRTARAVAAREAWGHVAGVTAAQDFSARDVQMRGGSAPQFSLGKSFPGFTPLGPVLVTPDEYSDPDAIGLQCRVNDVLVQAGSTADLLFPVPVLVSYLSHIVTLEPGDVILTGTPSGVGLGMRPPRFLRPGDIVTTSVQGVGQMRHVCRAAEPAFDAALVLA
jgi:2,4-diketo-3-deoxy-L-fuconate hydrolase